MLVSLARQHSEKHTLWIRVLLNMLLEQTYNFLYMLQYNLQMNHCWSYSNWSTLKKKSHKSCVQLLRSSWYKCNSTTSTTFFFLWSLNTWKAKVIANTSTLRVCFTLRWRSIVMTNYHETIHLWLNWRIILVGGGGYD